MLRKTLLALPLLAAACGTSPFTPPADTAALPRDAIVGAGDPSRSAIISTSAALGRQQRLDPAGAARTIAQMEFLAVDLPQNVTLYNASSTLEPQFRAARREWRSALDIAPDAPAQPVINALYSAGRALDAGQRDAAAAALPPTLFRQGGAATLARLAALPPLPQSASAAATAQQALQTSQPSKIL